MENLTLFIIINIINGAGYTLISPLLPILGKKENLSESTLGWMIGIFPISSCIMTTMIPILGKKFSRIKLLSYATFFAAISTFLYCVLIFISNKTLLIVFFFALRIFHGFCATIVCVLISSLNISSSKKENTQSNLGKSEIALSIGTSISPLICSIFYKIGGYTLPFLFTGAFSILAFCLSFQINDKIIRKESDEVEDDNNYNYLKYLTYPEIYSILLGFVFCMISVTFSYPCLTYHLINNYSISVSIASLFFIAPMVPYIITSQFLDKISAKIGIYFTFSLGLLLSGISSLFVYPTPPLAQSPINILIGFFILGIGSVPVFIPGLVMLSKNIKKIDDSIDEMSANDIAAAIYNLFVELGNFIGPILGGYLTDNFGFKLCCIIISTIVVTCSAIFFVFFYSAIKNDFILLCKNNKSNEKDNNSEELIEKEYDENYFKTIKASMLVNKISSRHSSTSLNENMKNNNSDSRISVCSTLTE